MKLTRRDLNSFIYCPSEGKFLQIFNIRHCWHPRCLNFEMHLNNEIVNYVFQYNKAFDIEKGDGKEEAIFLLEV
ncbi:hypothetical protein SDC9_124252 [bioreactor metagenome]|uniref:Uncharacterized protein n=1 Tax=bioreactor metagenome TaxID=1076179 RepID=A0A645CKH5_9ZZZZ